MDEAKIIRIVFALPFEAEEAEQIAQAFQKRLNYEAYQLRTEQDSRLLGGFVVYTGGKRYDYSMKGRLNKVATKLGEAELTPVGGTVEEGASGDLLGQLKQSLAEQSTALAKGKPESLAFLWETDGSAISQEELEQDAHLLLDDYHNRLHDGGGIEGVAIDEVGEVLSVGDGIAYVSGIEQVLSDELLLFDKGAYGLAMNLEANRVGVVLLGNINSITEGSICQRTGKTVSVPGGPAMMGRVVNALGEPIDGQGVIRTSVYRSVEQAAPSVINRQPVNQPLYTGITAIDAMTPIGKGQRELIIGDRQTGKTSIAIDTILNQKGKNIRCVYVSIGQKMSTLANVVNLLRQREAMSYTCVVSASASESAAMQYLAPYAACAIAESWMYDEHCDVLIVYDDLSKHAQAYRALSLLLRRPPGREAYPGDVFYLHSRLLERSCRLSEEAGGGSLTALPIVETQAGDISAYIPTNVISITDGQIYLETDLFFAGQRPAINVGLSVSRVGGAAQVRAMKKVAGSLRINLAQYKEIAAFSQFGSELDEATRSQIEKGESLNEVLVQTEHHPRTMAETVVLLHLATQAHLVELAKDDIRPFCQSFLETTHTLHPGFLERIEASGEFTEADQEELMEYFQVFKKNWQQVQEAELVD